MVNPCSMVSLAAGLVLEANTTSHHCSLLQKLKLARYEPSKPVAASFCAQGNQAGKYALFSAPTYALSRQTSPSLLTVSKAELLSVIITGEGAPAGVGDHLQRHPHDISHRQ